MRSLQDTFQRSYLAAQMTLADSCVVVQNTGSCIGIEFREAGTVIKPDNDLELAPNMFVNLSVSLTDLAGAKVRLMVMRFPCSPAI